MSNDHGRGVGIEITDRSVQGVRIDPTSAGRIAAAAERPVRGSDDDALLDALVVLNADLGEPSEPTRIATFPAGSSLQRLDITGRSPAAVMEVQERMRTQHSIRSSVVVDDGPRRWLLLIRWDENGIERVQALAERAGLAVAAIEPSAWALGRVAGVDTTFVRRLVAPGDSHQAVLHRRVPVAAMSTTATGRISPDVEFAVGPVALAPFDDFMGDDLLAESLDGARTRSGVPRTEEPGTESGPILDLAGIESLDVPDDDPRSARRQAVALGAALGAAGLCGPIQPIRVVGPTAGIGGDPLDRPWAIERVSPTADGATDDAAHGIERVTRWFRTRRPQ